MLTFINNLKAELDEKLGSLASVFTFHGYCYLLLRTDSVLRLGLSDDFCYLPALASLIKMDWQILYGTDAPPFIGLMRALDKHPAIDFYLQRSSYYDAVAYDDSVFRVYRRLLTNPDSIRTYEILLIDFAAMYAREPDGGVRAEIVKTFALIPNDSPTIRNILIDALRDPAIGVRHYAMRGARRLQTPDALPRLADALRDADPGVRFGAVQALAAHGASAGPYLEILERMSSTERDQRVRSEIGRTITTLRRAQRP